MRPIGVEEARRRFFENQKQQATIAEQQRSQEDRQRSSVTEVEEDEAVRLNIQISKQEMKRLKIHCVMRGITMSEEIRGHINSLK